MNQTIFRAASGGSERVTRRPDAPVTFLCECGDETCTATVEVSAADYARLKTERGRVLVARGHESK